MRNKTATLCLLCAWLCANGAVSHFAQIFAWSRMFAGYARELSVCAALTRTFDPAKPCDLCVAVQTTQESENGRPTALSLNAEKLLLACLEEARPVPCPPSPDRWQSTEDWHVLTRTEPVPSRPPRA